MILACPICCYVPLAGNLFAMVDPEDWVDLHKFHWYIKKGRGGMYAYRKLRKGRHQQRLYMHREIMHTKKGDECHHGNRNTLDQRKENLKNCTIKEHEQISQINRLIHRRGTKPIAGTGELPHN